MFNKSEIKRRLFEFLKIYAIIHFNCLFERKG